jgi:hypothetical protein
VLYLKWDLGDLAGCEVERAVIKLRLADGVSGGRLGAYPIVAKGLGAAGVMEYMPRWEERTTYGLGPGDTLAVEVTGIASEWAKGELVNRGLALVYEGFPGEQRQVAVRGTPELHVEHLPVK